MNACSQGITGTSNVRCAEEVIVAVTFGTSDHYVRIDNTTKDGGRVGRVGIDIKSRSGEQIGTDRFQMLSAILEVVKAYCGGIEINRYFNPTMQAEEDNEIIKCQWTRSNKLRIIGRQMKVRFQHASTIQEAVARHRNFTMTVGLWKLVPKARG